MSNEEQIDLPAKPVLTGLLSDADYIKELEGLVCFLAGCYEKVKETYFDKHMSTCSIENPDRRDLTDAEQSEWQRFPMIQGTALQHIISDIAKLNKPTPTDAQGLLRRFEAPEISSNPAITRFLVVYDKRDKTFGYMETVWTNEELYFRWKVISEHKTKDESRIACDVINGR